MKNSVLLTPNVGIALAILAVALLFWIEARRELGRPPSVMLRLSGAIAVVAVVLVAVGRVVVYA